MKSIQIDIKIFLPKSVKHRDREIDPMIDRYNDRQTKDTDRHKDSHRHVWVNLNLDKYKDR